MSRTSRTSGCTFATLRQGNAFARLNSFWEAIKNKTFELQRCRAGLRKQSHFWSMELFFFSMYSNVIFSCSNRHVEQKSTPLFCWPWHRISPAYDWRSWCPADSSHRPPAVRLTRAWSRFQGVERWLRWRWGKSTREQHKMGLVVIETLGPTCIQSFQSTMWKQRVGMGHKYCRLCQGNTVPSFVVFRLLLGWWYAQKRCVYQRLKASNYLGCGQLLSHIQLNCPLFPQYVCPYMGFLHIQLGILPESRKVGSPTGGNFPVVTGCSCNENFIQIHVSGSMISSIIPTPQKIPSISHIIPYPIMGGGFLKSSKNARMVKRLMSNYAKLC